MYFAFYLKSLKTGHCLPFKLHIIQIQITKQSFEFILHKYSNQGICLWSHQEESLSHLLNISIHLEADLHCTDETKVSSPSSL